MKNCLIITILGTIVGVSIVVSCAIAGGSTKPSVGTVRAFNASEIEVTSAITNAFKSGHYNDMLLGPAVGSGELARGWHPTNGFVLFPGTGTRYYAYFHIVVFPTSTNLTKVVVRTIEADVVNGKEPGLHGGLALHFSKTQPIPKEEENVLSAIAQELDAAKHTATTEK